jgi:ABC-type multidrug transport system fused ATPase/permease subunit
LLSHFRSTPLSLRFHYCSELTISPKSVDTGTDVLMQAVIRSEFRGRTVIAIAHRLDTIMDFDRVVVMDQGQIVEVGPPAVLREKENSYFRTLWKN